MHTFTSAVIIDLSMDQRCADFVAHRLHLCGYSKDYNANISIMIMGCVCPLIV